MKSFFPLISTASALSAEKSNVHETHELVLNQMKNICTERPDDPICQELRKAEAIKDAALKLAAAVHQQKEASEQAVREHLKKEESKAVKEGEKNVEEKIEAAEKVVKKFQSKEEVSKPAPVEKKKETVSVAKDSEIKMHEVASEAKVEDGPVAPEQGYSGDLVHHDNGVTSTEDWRTEYPNNNVVIEEAHYTWHYYVGGGVGLVVVFILGARYFQ